VSYTIAAIILFMRIVFLKYARYKTNILKHSNLDGQPRQKRNMKKDSYLILQWAFSYYPIIVCCFNIGNSE